MPTEALQELMLAAFGEQRNASHFRVLHKTDVMLQLVFEQAAGQEGGPRFCFSGDALFEDLRTEVRPSMAHDLRSLLEYYSFFPLSLDTKQYRPRQKPIVADDDDKVYGRGGLKQSKGRSISLVDRKKKRKLVVRDWFHYVVWALRVKKALSAA